MGRRLGTRDRGQVLPLFALMIIVIMGMAALAVDVGRKYVEIRSERSAGDASSLSGAQDLQLSGSRTVTATEQAQARGHALKTLVDQLHATGTGTGACATSADLVDCQLAGTPYVVSIKTPAPSCNQGGSSTCDAVHSVQVTVRNPTFETTFSRVLGQSTWNVGTTSVAGLDFGKSYAIITLRPPKRAGATFIINDIEIDGGSVVNVLQGDVGTNSNMIYAGTGSSLTLQSGYNMYYYPGSPPTGPQWGSSPAGLPLTTLIKDPNYRYPAMSGSLGTAPTFDDARTSRYATLPAVERADTDASCAAEIPKLSTSAYTFMSPLPPLSSIYCYNPGIYLSGSGAKNATITVGTGEIALLKPGAYYLKSGMDISGRLIGGYEAGMPGVALMFDEVGPGNCSSCILNGNNALTIALNAGTKFPPGASGGTAATAAVDWDNKKVETSGPGSPTPPLVMTLLVNKDPDCAVPTAAPFWEPVACNANKNKTLNMAGGGSLALEGVQYAPTDNVEIHGGSTGDGRVGQIISWTLFYSGGTHINQLGPSSIGNGILRIDPACSAPGEPCVNP